MRFVDGPSLGDLLADGTPLSPARAARIVARVAGALDAAHARGLVHRDVKPGNVLIADLDGDEQVYLTDFGLSLQAAGSAVGPDKLEGTLAYLAPEQIRGEPLDARTDVYALGCVLFHALTARAPFTGDQAAVIEAHLSAPPPSVSDVVPGVPPAMDDVVRRAMAKRPEDRFATAGEFALAALAARFDVALCYHPDDAARAEDIAAALREQGLQVVLAGEGRAAADATRASGSCAVLIGSQRLGTWARYALVAGRQIANQDRAFRLVAVLLPGGPDPLDPGLAFMATHPWADLREGTAEGIDDLMRALRSPAPPVLGEGPDVCPYRGLESFGEEHAEYFFGREGDVARLVEMLRRGRFVAVIGPSGSGKSSIVHAGLLPAVRRGGVAGGESWRRLDLTPGEKPLDALAAQLSTLPGAGAPSAADLAADESALDAALAGALDGRPEDETVLVVVDQLEEAFTLCQDAGARAAFLSGLVYAATVPGGRAAVVVAMRADFYHRLAEHDGMRAAAAASQFALGPMDAAALRRAIEQPARQVGLELEPGLSRRILTDVAGRPGALPLLEYLLLELWQRRRGKTLTLEAYGASGGVQGALARRANLVYSGMSPERQAITRRVLLRLTQPGEGAEDTRRRATMRELVTRPDEQEEVEAVVGALAEARLLTADRDEATGDVVVDVTHEALIRGWPELRGWIDEDRERLRLQRRLTEATADWSASGREEGLLYRGGRLGAWEGRDEADLNQDERDFLAASRERAVHEAEVRRRRVKIAIGALAAGLIAIAAVAIFALVQRNDANDQRDVARSRQLAGSSVLARQRDPELATLLAESAYAASPTGEAEQSLRQAVHNSPIRATLRTPDKLSLAGVPAPEGRVAVVTEPGTMLLWDPEKDPRGASPEVVGKWAKGISVPPAPTTEGWVTGDKAGELVLWPGLATPGAPQRIAKVPGQIFDLHPLPGGDGVIAATTNGSWVVGLADRRPRRVTAGYLNDAVATPASGTYITAGVDGAVQRWTDRSTTAAAGAIPVKGMARALTVSPDGTLLAVSTGDGVDVVRLADDTTVFSVPVTGGANDVAWSPDGRRIAAGGGDNSVRVYTSDGRLLSLMKGHETSVNTVAFVGPRTVVSVAGDGTARAWDATAGVEEQLRGHTPASVGAVTFDDRGRVTVVESDGAAVSWTPGRATARPVLPALTAPGSVYSAAAAGDLVATGSFDGSVTVRDASDDTVASATFPQELPIGVALDPRGRRAAIALSGGRVEVMDLAPGAKPQTVERHAGSSYVAAFSPVDDTIASGGRNGTVKVTGGPGGSRTLGTHGGGVTGVAFSPSGRWLVSGSLDRTVRVWDLAGKEPPRIIRSHQGSVVAVAFAGEDRIVSAADDGVQVTDWRRGVTLLSVPRAAAGLSVTGDAPAIAYYGTDNVVREISCDVCGPIDRVEAAAQERTTRDLTEAEQADFHVQN
jgi:WD40 repeat protein